MLAILKMRFGGMGKNDMRKGAWFFPILKIHEKTMPTYPCNTSKKNHERNLSPPIILILNALKQSRTGTEEKLGMRLLRP